MEASELPLKQPRSLYAFTFSIIWDRFSFYGTRALLILYLTKVFLFTDDRAYSFYSLYIALGYAGPIIGGYIADRYIGSRQAIILGALGMVIGSVLLTLPLPNILILHCGLALVTLGSGFFNPNLTNSVGSLYTTFDSRRDSGFTIFYMGMNIGALLGPILFALISLKLGWHTCFIFSAISMLVSLIVYLSINYEADKNATKTYPKPFYLIAALILVAITTAIFFYPEVADGVIACIALLLFVFMIFYSFKYPPKQRNSMIILIFLFIFSAFYFAGNMQTASSITLFIDRFVNHKVLGWNLPAITFSALSPLLIIAITPIIVFIWTQLGKVNREPNVAFKLAIGLLLTGVSFYFFAHATFTASNDAHYSTLFWIVLANLFMAAGELCIVPCITAAITRLSPNDLKGTLMGMFSLALVLASFIGKLLSDISKPTKHFHGVHAFQKEFHFVFLIMIITAIVALGFAMLIKSELKESK